MEKGSELLTSQGAPLQLLPVIDQWQFDVVSIDPSNL